MAISRPSISLMVFLLHNLIKYGVLISLPMLVSACSTALLINPDPSKPLTKTKERYSVVYEEDLSASDIIEFVIGQDVVVIASLEQAKVINLTNLEILKEATSNGSMIVYAQSSVTNDRFLFAASGGFAEIWDTNTWEVIRRFKGYFDKFENGLSPDGKMVYFNGTLWSVASGEKIITPGADPRVDVHAFSWDSRYFVNGGYGISFDLIDLNNNRNIPRKSVFAGVAQISFRRDNHFYANYNAESFRVIGGYNPNQLGLFDHTDNDLISSVTFNSRITCWNTMQDDNVFVVLTNGDVILLNTQLAPVDKWNLTKYWQGKDNITHCTAGPDKRLWLATDHSGVFKLDVARKTISNPIKTTHSYRRLTVSRDGKYLGISEDNSKGGNTVKVYQIQK